MLFVLSAPSGAGKSTIAREIMRLFPSIKFSVSATTRARRQKEMEGRDYFFLTHEQFKSRIEAGDLIEWEEVFGNYYGTLKSQVDAAIAAGHHMIFDIDVKGGLSIKRIYGDLAVLIFIKPPGMDVLRERLERRGSDDAAGIETRLARANWELEQAPGFDYVVVNDDLKRSVPEVASIITDRLEAQTIELNTTKE
jgi:guanylate kinase